MIAQAFDQKDCNTCANHLQGCINIPSGCLRCLEASRGPGTYLPLWTPLKEIKMTPQNITEAALTKSTSALSVQVAGGHYKDLKIQPVEYIHANGLPFMEGSVVKYVTRWRNKGGLDDLKKARHFLDMLIELEAAKRATTASASPVVASRR